VPDIPEPDTRKPGMPFTVRRAGRPLDAVETWIFDLDNTLYPAASHLFDQVRVRMTRFIAARLELTEEDALQVQKRYFREHGTTLRGLMDVNGVDPQEFLSFVHDIDLAKLPPDPALAAALEALPGRKLVHTNGSVWHAERILERLGIGPSFHGIVDIEAAGYEPKPAPVGYRELVRRHGVDPGRALMVEDIAKNLVPAALLGMTTAWLRNDLDWARAGGEGEHIHYVVDDLVGFLAAAVPPGGA
jgi:putative hydrolase of the HAD superfamily